MRKFAITIVASAALMLGCLLYCGCAEQATSSGEKKANSASGDKMSGDKMSGDKMSGDKMGSDKMGSGKMSDGKM
jgi:hypothetical protein